mmetsp:Transcript_17103/g.39432  ORF Transcript_17103/g.39432 Transcript_17103/m.39432 type:complete len:123 (-) Transcript_17103:57-425(-)
MTKAAHAMPVFSESYPATAAAPQVLTPAFNFSPLHPYHFEAPLGIYDNEDLRAEARFWVRTNASAKAKWSKGASTRGRNRNRRRRQLKRRGSWARGVKGNSKATSHRQLNFSHSPLTQPVAP